MKKILVLLFLACFHSIAQTNFSNIDYKQYAERLIISTNTNTILNGENLFYKIFNLNLNRRNYSPISKIAYVELINSKKEIVLRDKINLENSTGSGFFFIPSSLTTGNYKLTAYTKWMTNEIEEAFVYKNIFIINPFQNTPKEYIHNPDNTKAAKIGIDLKHNSTLIKLPKRTFGKREHIISKLENLPKGHYFISARKINQLPQPYNESFNQIINKYNVVLRKDSVKTLPELRGEIISGKIISKEIFNEGVVALSSPGDNFIFRLTNIKRDGSFHVSLPSHPNNGKFIVQLIDNQKILRIDIDSVRPDYENIKFDQDLKLTASLKQVIEERSIALQIENAYFKFKRDSIVQPLYEKSKFYGEPIKSYILDNYNRFSTIAETIIEITPEIYYTKKKNNYIIHSKNYYNNSTNEIYGSTLVLVDGVPIQDFNHLFEYPAADIEKIDIINKGYVYGSKVFNGIVNFYTKSQNYPYSKKDGLQFNIQRIDNKRKQYQPNYSEDSYYYKRIPDYRYQLLWLSEIKSDEVLFYTSDITGTFEIKLEGITENGEFISEISYFQVK